MTRISSLFVATTLAILPISAFAQPDAAPAKTTTPSAAISQAQVAPSAPANTTAPAASKMADGKTVTTVAPANTAANVTQPARHDDKTPGAKANMSGGKTEVHGMNTVKAHDTRTNTPEAAKVAAPTKS